MSCFNFTVFQVALSPHIRSNRLSFGYCFDAPAVRVRQGASLSLVMLFLSVHLGTGVQVRSLSSFTSAAMKRLLYILRYNVTILIKATLRMLLEIFGYMQVIGVSPASISAWDVMKTVKKEWNNDSEWVNPPPTQQRIHKMKSIATLACGSI